MRTAYLLLLLMSTVCVAQKSNYFHLTPENIIIISDLNDVLVRDLCYLINDTLKIYRYLKAKGYHFALATNNDLLAYEWLARRLGSEFNLLTNKIFVATNKNRKTEPHDTIFQAPGSKPKLKYYKFMEKILGTHFHMVLIDDKRENIKGFKKLQKHAPTIRHGIRFKNPQQLAKKLIKLGILSKIDDNELLQDIGIM